MAHGHGVICAEPYAKMDGPYFARFIRHHFPILFDITRANDNTKPKLFVMDNDPSQTSAVARKDCLEIYWSKHASYSSKIT